jgi:hypothetical protein
MYTLNQLTIIGFTGNDAECRRKMRMSYLCHLEMSG